MLFILLFGAITTASSLGGNPEVFSDNNGVTLLDTANGHCDPLEHLMGMCRSSKDLIQEN